MSMLSKKLLLTAALLVMPLQGVAATLPMLLCHGDVRAHVMAADTPGDRATHGDSQPHDGGTGGKPANHACGHNIVCSAPSATPLVAPLDTLVRAFAPEAAHEQFCPDRPDRPPLA